MVDRDPPALGMMQIQSSSGNSTKQGLLMNQPHSGNPDSIRPSMRQYPQDSTSDGNKRVGIPPSHPNQIPPISPYSQIQAPRPGNPHLGSRGFTPGPAHSHTRSLSQSSIFNFDNLPPMIPSPFRESLSSSLSDHVPGDVDVSMEDRDNSLHSLLPPSPFPRGNLTRVSGGENLPSPRKAHRRSNSDIPFLNSLMQSSLPLIPTPSKGLGVFERSVSGREDKSFAKPAQLVKEELSGERVNYRSMEGMGEHKSEREVVDDLFSAYMNLDGINALNSSGTDEKSSNDTREDLGSRASGTKTNRDSSDNEAESNINESVNRMQRIGSSSNKSEGMKRSAVGDIAPASRHYRSVSMDSFTGKLNFADEVSKLPPPGQLSPQNSPDTNSNAISLEFGTGEFNGVELKKIMGNEKLAEIALTDPKRVKRILANRQSAARSKERKMRYIQELEHKVQTLQTEATTLSAQFALLQRDSVGLTNQNNELKFRLQAMEQQAQLRDALNETLNAEVQRLKLVMAEIGGEVHPSKSVDSQLNVNQQMLSQLQQQASHLNISQTQQQQRQPCQSQQKNRSGATKPQSKH